jgi:hypothetical protein
MFKKSKNKFKKYVSEPMPFFFKIHPPSNQREEAMSQGLVQMLENKSGDHISHHIWYLYIYIFFLLSLAYSELRQLRRSIVYDKKG